MIGMDVYTDDPKEHFGKLKDVMATGANDVYVIDSDKHGEVLVPAIRQCIMDIDVEERKMTIHLMEDCYHDAFSYYDVISGMVMAGLGTSITGRAIDRGLLSIDAVNIRDYAFNKHNSVDDYPYGGGAGMLMQAEPVYLTYEAIREKINSREGKEASQAPRVIYLSPRGKHFPRKWQKSLQKRKI